MQAGRENMAMKEEELARWFETRRGDTSLWSDAPVKATVRRGGSVVFSVRFSPGELELLRQRAKQAGTTISELVRSAALRCGADASRIQTVADERWFTPQGPLALVLATCSASQASGLAFQLSDPSEGKRAKREYVFGAKGGLPSLSRSG